ncbi:hypothetical protein [Zavarzinia sp.]|uniref:hypothetical protein n=1 Tax=Zavarzinia sp. TaxID=2027920 RepID=UPI0032118173
MAKKCGYSAEVSNGAKAAVTTFVVGAFASVMKRLGKKKYYRPTVRQQKRGAS